MHTLRSIFAACLLLCALSAKAEGGCPPGQYPQQGQGWRTCVPMATQNGQGTDDVFRGPRKEARWLVLAVDSDKAILGKGINGVSESDATQTAMIDCKGQGGVSCHVIASVKNQCAAMIVGKRMLVTSDGPSQRQAESNGKKKCEDAPDTNCQVYFSACVFPAIAD